jgi:hypothetical protein
MKARRVRWIAVCVMGVLPLAGSERAVASPPKARSFNIYRFALAIDPTAAAAAIIATPTFSAPPVPLAPSKSMPQASAAQPSAQSPLAYRSHRCSRHPENWCRNRWSGHSADECYCDLGD